MRWNFKSLWTKTSANIRELIQQFMENIICYRTLIISFVVWGKLTLNVWGPNLSRPALLNHVCWCPGDRRSEDISTHDIGCIKLVRIAITCVMLVWINDINWNFNLMFSVENWSRKGLMKLETSSTANMYCSRLINSQPIPFGIWKHHYNGYRISNMIWFHMIESLDAKDCHKMTWIK